MLGDDPHEDPADLTATLKLSLLLRPSIRAWVGLMGHAQIAAQHSDAGLPVLLPVISQPSHSVHPGQSYGWCLTT